MRIDKMKWQDELINAITKPEELFNLLGLNKELLPAAEKAAKLFPFKVPRNFVERMEKGNFHDPLLRQILPIDAEYCDTPGYSADPLQEKKFNPMPGLLHKYHGRVLLTLTGACGIHCRYCFRREFSYENNNPGTFGWQKVMSYIANDPTIAEVILSGGDPLVVPDSTLKNLIEQFPPSVKRLRIHSRMPIVLPSRITSELIDAITHPSLKTILVVHCNHPREINHEVKEAMQLLKSSGIALLNQTVFLKNVNDQAETLIELSETLFDAGIQPYYLHTLDKVKGAAHFDLSLEKIRGVYRKLSESLSGYLVPKLVCEQPGAHSKTLINLEEFYTE